MIILFFFFAFCFSRLKFTELLVKFTRRRCFEWFFVIFIEVAGVALLALWQERRLHFALVYGYPVGVRVPLVGLDVVDAILQVAKTFCQVDL